MTQTLGIDASRERYASSVDPPIAVALDMPDLKDALALTRRLLGHVGMFKVGFELYGGAGPAAVQAIRDVGGRVFLDLKVADIPNTTAAAVRQAAACGAELLTIHGFGGRAMIEAAADASRAAGGPRLLVVTVLTSLGDADLAEIGVDRPVSDQVGRIARIAQGAGAHGLILSPRELGAIRPSHPELLLVTPGVRPAGHGIHDHSRAMTPGEAISGGADVLVVGRPITAADDPVAAAAAVADEVRLAAAERT